MIPRYQTVLFLILLLASAIMGVILWQSLNRAHERLLAGERSTPTQAPAVSPSQPATLLVANDADNSLLAQIETLPLPADPGSRARAYPRQAPRTLRRARLSASGSRRRSFHRPGLPAPHPRAR